MIKIVCIHSTQINVRVEQTWTLVFQSVFNHLTSHLLCLYLSPKDDLHIGRNVYAIKSAGLSLINTHRK